MAALPSSSSSTPTLGPSTTRPAPLRPADEPTRTALVLGGGFAGVESAVRLARAGLDVTLVSARPSLFVYPTSIWVVTGEHQVAQDLIDLEALARQHGFRFVLGTVEHLEAERRVAVVEGAELTADVLVLALGAGKPALAGLEHTTSLWGGPADTEAIAERLAALVEQGHGRVAIGFGSAPADPSAVRGGPAFEVMFNVDRMLRRRGLREKFELTFFAPMEKPGERMGAGAADAVRAMFERLDIGMRFGERIAGFDPEGVSFADGSRLDADLVVFVPGGVGHPALRAAGLPLNEAGFVRIDDRCRVEGHDAIYAVGDAAALAGPEWRAKQGHLAELMADVAAADIVAAEHGARAPHGYVEHVSILCLMDTGNAAAWVSRDTARSRLVYLPWIGHWMKKGWAAYYRAGKLRLVPFIRWALGELGREVRRLLHGGYHPVPALPLRRPAHLHALRHP